MFLSKSIQCACSLKFLTSLDCPDCPTPNCMHLSLSVVLSLSLCHTVALQTYLSSFTLESTSIGLEQAHVALLKLTLYNLTLSLSLNTSLYLNTSLSLSLSLSQYLSLSHYHSLSLVDRPIVGFFDPGTICLDRTRLRHVSSSLCPFVFKSKLFFCKM